MELIRICIPKYQLASSLWVEENRYMKGHENQMLPVFAVFDKCINYHIWTSPNKICCRVQRIGFSQCTRFRVPLPILLNSVANILGVSVFNLKVILK